MIMIFVLGPSYLFHIRKPEFNAKIMHVKKLLRKRKIFVFVLICLENRRRKKIVNVWKTQMKHFICTYYPHFYFFNLL